MGVISKALGSKTMIGRITNLYFDRDGKQVLTLTIDGDARKLYDDLHDTVVDIEIKKHREKRSLSANAYFHLLANKIAQAIGTSEDEAKAELVCSYGVYARDEEGGLIGIKLPSSVNPQTIYPYTKFIESRMENGKEFRCYLLYKRTRYMDTAEMARLIDGAIYEAKELGIETDPPEKIAKLKSLLEREDK